MKIGKQIETERGLVYVVREYLTADEAKNNGYTYAFSSYKLNCDLYSKCLDDRGLYHEFVTVKGDK